MLEAKRGIPTLGSKRGRTMIIDAQTKEGLWIKLILITRLTFTNGQTVAEKTNQTVTNVSPSLKSLNETIHRPALRQKSM